MRFMCWCGSAALAVALIAGAGSGSAAAQKGKKKQQKAAAAQNSTGGREAFLHMPAFRLFRVEDGRFAGGKGLDRNRGSHGSVSKWTGGGARTPYWNGTYG